MADVGKHFLLPFLPFNFFNIQGKLICDYLRVLAKVEEKTKFSSVAKKLYVGIKRNEPRSKFPALKHEIKKFVQQTDSVYWFAKATTEEHLQELKKKVDQAQVIFKNKFQFYGL